MNEKVRSRVLAAEMGFLRRTSGSTLLDKVKSADTRESINMESLLLQLERSQLRWLGMCLKENYSDSPSNEYSRHYSTETEYLRRQDMNSKSGEEQKKRSSRP